MEIKASLLANKISSLQTIFFICLKVAKWLIALDLEQIKANTNFKLFSPN
jgi:hypothetical protein